MENTAEILQENTQLKEILSEKDSIIERKTQRIQLLEEFIRSLQQKQFGASSEKLEAVQPDLFVEAEDEADAAVNLAAEDHGIIICYFPLSRRKITPFPAKFPS